MATHLLIFVHFLKTKGLFIQKNYVLIHQSATKTCSVIDVKKIIPCMETDVQTDTNTQWVSLSFQSIKSIHRLWLIKVHSRKHLPNILYRA